MVHGFAADVVACFVLVPGLAFDLAAFFAAAVGAVFVVVRLVDSIDLVAFFAAGLHPVHSFVVHRHGFVVDFFLHLALVVVVFVPCLFLYLCVCG